MAIFFNQQDFFQVLVVQGNYLGFSGLAPSLGLGLAGANRGAKPQVPRKEGPPRVILSSVSLVIVVARALARSLRFSLRSLLACLLGLCHFLIRRRCSLV
jgi:hypothetical protein